MSWLRVGLFSIVDVWRWNPADFLGSHILPITAHSNVLQEFGSGDTSTAAAAPARSIRSDLLAVYGCIRLSNPAITRFRRASSKPAW